MSDRSSSTELAKDRVLRGVDGAIAATCFLAGTLFAAGGLAFLGAVFVAAAFVFFVADRVRLSST